MKESLLALTALVLVVLAVVTYYNHGPFLTVLCVVGIFFILRRLRGGGH